jgi:hypothetical protein
MPSAEIVTFSYPVSKEWATWSLAISKASFALLKRKKPMIECREFFD